MTNSVENFDVYSRYYDLLYRDKDYRAEAEYVVSILEKNSISSGLLLEFGSGTGKHGRIISESGYKVHGIERSETMVANSLVSERFTCEQGDVCTIELGKTYDAVLSLFHVVSYQTSNKKLLSIFESAYKHLVPGGVFVFDVWYTPAVLSQKPEARVKIMEDEYTEVIRIAEPIIKESENCVDVNYTILAIDRKTRSVEKIHELHPMRHLSIPEVEMLSSFVGFEFGGAEEFMTGKSPSAETWGVCFTLKKRRH